MSCACPVVQEGLHPDAQERGNYRVLTLRNLKNTSFFHILMRRNLKNRVFLHILCFRFLTYRIRSTLNLPKTS